MKQIHLFVYPNTDSVDCHAELNNMINISSLCSAFHIKNGTQCIDNFPAGFNDFKGECWKTDKCKADS